MRIINNIQEFIKKYKETIETIKNEELDSNDEKLEIRDLERKLIKLIKANVKELSDDEMLELISLMNDDYNIADGIKMLSNDDLKVEKLGKIEDGYLKTEIILTLEDDQKKIDLLKNASYKKDILESIKDEKLILEYLDNNPEDKKAIIEDIVYYKMNSRIDKKDWEFIEKAGIKNQVISHLLSSTRFKCLDKMTDEMKKDVEDYFGRNIPENIEELTDFEKIGIDLDVLQDDVIVDKEQLELDELQDEYMKIVRTNEKNKKTISIKDFIGTISPNLKEDANKENIRTLGDLMKSLKRMENNVESHNDKMLFLGEGSEAIRINGLNGKYFVTGNGNHRLTVLKARYLTEIKRANGDNDRIKQIEEEYKIDVSSAVNIPDDKEEILAINILDDISDIKELDVRIEEFIENGEKTGYLIKNGEEETKLSSKEEIREYVKKSIEGVKENPQYKDKWEKLVEEYKIKEAYSEEFTKLTGIENNKTNENKEEEAITNNEETINKTKDEEELEIKREKEESIRDTIETITKDQNETENEKGVSAKDICKQCYEDLKELPEEKREKTLLKIKDIMRTIKEKIKELTNDKYKEGIMNNNER